MKKTLSIILVLLLCSCSMSKSAETTSEVADTYTFEVFDTIGFIDIYGVHEFGIGDSIGNDLINYLKRYDKLLSKTDKDSDLYAVNHRTTDSVMISPITARLFEYGKDFYEWTDGAFDISAGTLIELWDIKNRTTVPSLEEINEARKHCGNFNYTIEKGVDPTSEKSARITFSGDKKTLYDFGALAKGLAADGVKEMIKNHPMIKAALVNLGGNVTCIGKHPGRKDGAFNIGIVKPFSGNVNADTLKVVGRNVITSGDYQRYFKVEGDDRIYHHIIDPRTGYPTNNNLDSVSIVSEIGLLGDFLSTSGMLLGIDETKDLLDFCKESSGDSNIQAIFIEKNGKVSKYPKFNDATKPIE